MTKNCMGFPLGVALDRLAGKETLSFLDIAALLIYPRRRSKGDHWFSSYFPHSSETAFASISIPSVFGLFAHVTLHKKDILGGSHKGVKHKILVPVFHVFPNLTDAVNFNTQYI